MTTLNPIEELVDEFARSIIKRDETKDIRAKNRYARECNAAFDSLTGHFNDDGREALTRLLHHENMSVQVMAAAFLLRYCTKDAMAVLMRLAAGKGTVALAAQCTIENWNEGRWELDPEPKT